MKRDQVAMRRVSLDACQICGGHAEHRHHIVNRSLTQNDDADNLMPLCNRCHNEVHRHSVDIGVYLTPEQGAKAVLLLKTVSRAYGHLYPSANPRRIAA